MRKKKIDREPGDHRLGARMRELRRQYKRVSQEDVAGLMGIKPATLGEFENGVRMPSLHRLRQFCQAVALLPSDARDLFQLAMNVTIGDLLDFGEIMQRHKSPIITPYRGWGWRTIFSLQQSPDRREGWPVSQVVLAYDGTNPFVMPAKYADAYQEFFDKFYAEKRFFDDGKKFMLELNPTSFSDTPTLSLLTRSCRYSEAYFCRDHIAKDPMERGALITQLVQGSLKADFPHTLHLQMIVATSDDKILLTERSPKLTYYPGVWSCTVEENLMEKDFEDGPRCTLLKLTRRLFHEELSLDESAYSTDALRLLSVLLESDVLNIGLCGYTKLRIDSKTLDRVLREIPPEDIEFTKWEFLDLSRDELLRELLQPPRNYHPSGGYRLLLTFLKQFDIPTQAEIALIEAAEIAL
jgi:transcriptional regulator with XRE-family HTH domain